MKDSMNTLFRQRFQGHEVPVDAGVWAGIQAQVAAGPGADGVNELLKERFQGHEVAVDPQVWSGISSQLGHPAAAGLMARTWAWAGAGVAAVAITLAVVLGTDPTPATVATTQAPEPTMPAVPGPTSPTDRKATLGTARTEAEEPAQNAAVAIEPDLTKKEPSPNTAHQVAERSVPTRPIDHAERRTIPMDAATNQAERTPEPGNTVVSAIITDLEEQVIHQPITAQPEPGLSAATVEEGIGPVSGTASNMVPEPLQASETPLPKLFMPNTFTPNGDGINDDYSVDGDGFGTILVRVYSMKSNALVFTTNSGEPWSGVGCEDGMYMVAVEAHTRDGRTMTEGKVVWLNRNRIN